MVLSFRSSRPARLSFPVQPDPSEAAQAALQGALHASQGDTKAALRCYQSALLIDDTRADLWFNYGVLQQRAGLLADARESFEFALRQEPAMYTARFRIARICYELGHPLEALQQFRIVTQQRPGYLPAWRYLVQITWALGNLDEAELLAHRALARARDNEILAMLERIAQDRAETLKCAGRDPAP